MTALTIDIQRKQYPAKGSNPAHLAIAGIRLSVEEREFVCLLGPSGCGKTTLLNLIAGLDNEYDGRIDVHQTAGRRLAYVFQTPRLLPWRTVLENIALVAEPGAPGLQAAESLLAEVDLQQFQNAFPGQISLGMQRRVALARAFAFHPALLLMDEPFVSLDEPSAARLRNLLVKLWCRHPTTVLFVTHDVREAIRLAERLVILSDAPAKVARQVPVTLSADERADAMAVEDFRNRVLGGVNDSFFHAEEDRGNSD